MKQFIAFYNSSFDSEITAQTYADQASSHAKAIKKAIDSFIVDVTNNDPAKKFWNTQNTIACVTVDNDALKESRLNPSALADIDGMIDRL